MDLFDAINARRSVRKYVNEPVDRSLLERIVQAGAEAPSGCNMQLRQFVIVDDPAMMEQIRPMNRAFVDAPAAIVLLIEPKAAPFGEYWVQDASAAMQSMLLAAVGLGLAGCWVEGGKDKWQEPIRQLLGVPMNLRPWAMTPIGKPAESPARPSAKLPATQITHYNRFGAK